MSFAKDQYSYLLNTLQFKGITNDASNWNFNDNARDMKAALKEILNNLKYSGKKNNFSDVKQYIETLPNQNIIEEEPIHQLNLESNQNLIPNEVDEEPILSLNIQSNSPGNQNFILNGKMAQRGKYGLNTDPSMEALITLLGEKRKEIKKMEKIMTPQRAQEFVYAQNHRFDKKLNNLSKRRNST
jgi:hypothetical protein